MQHVDGTKTGVFGGFIRRVLEHHGNGTGEYRQYLACRRHRQGDGDTGSNALLTDDNQNGRDNTGERRIGRLRCADVHPAKSD